MSKTKDMYMQFCEEKQIELEAAREAGEINNEDMELELLNWLFGWRY